jgi:hypothetical protein
MFVAATVVVVTQVGVDPSQRARPQSLTRVAATLQHAPAPLSSAEARRTARRYADQSDRTAAATLRTAFGDVVRSSGWPDVRAQRGVRVKRVLRGGHRAVVSIDGHPAQVQSMLPLTLAGADGKVRPVSTRLHARGGALVAQNVPSDYRLNRSLGRAGASVPAVSFGRAGFTLSPGVGSTAEVVSGKAFWGNVSRDTDFIATPLPTGVEALWQLRSADSPTHLRLRVGGVDDVRLGDGGAAELVRGGRRVGTLTPPRASDADGRQVAVTWKADGSSLVLDVDHRAKPVRYPVLVDPYVADDQRYWVANAAMDFTGWQFSGNTAYVAGVKGSGSFGNGLNLAVLARSSGIPSGTIGRYDFHARATPGPFFGEGAHIFKADFGYTAAVVSGLSASCWQEGIIGNNGLAEPTGIYRGSQVSNTYTAYPLIPNTNVHQPFVSCVNEGTAGQVLTYGYRVHCLSQCGLEGGDPTLGTPGNTATLTINPVLGGSLGAFVYMGASLIFESEQYGPHNQLTGLPAGGGWVDDVALTAQADDYGLGTAAISATAPTTSWAGSTAPTPACITSTPNPPQGGTPGSSNQGDRNHPCAQTMTTSFRTGAANAMPEGSYNVHIHSADIVQNATDTDVPVKVDHTPPTITASGSLYDVRDGYVADDHDYALSVSATDGSTAPASAQRSGVVSLAASLDGQPMTNSPVTAPCTAPQGSCSLTLNTTLTAAQIQGLDDTVAHAVTITATDAVGHPTTSTINFKIDTNDPDLALSGALWDAQDDLVSDPSYELDIDASDGDSDAPSSGVKSIAVSVDDIVKSSQDQACAAGNCDMSGSFTFSPQDYSEGEHDIVVTVTDQAGLSTNEEFVVDVVHIADQPPKTLSASSAASTRFDGAASGDHSGSSVSDVGDVNGDGHDDYAIGAPNASPNLLLLNAGSVFIVFGGASGTVDLNALNGTNGYRINAATLGDGAGTAVAAAGDVNGDGVGDLLIGAPGLLGLQGNVYVIFGSRTNSTLTLNALGARGFKIKGPLLSGAVGGLLAGTGGFGSTLSGRAPGEALGSGDVNGDGLDDIVIGSSTENRNSRLLSGSAYVVFGKADTATVDTASLGTQGFRIDGAQATDQAGAGAAIRRRRRRRWLGRHRRHGARQPLRRRCRIRRPWKARHQHRLSRYPRRRRLHDHCPNHRSHRSLRRGRR